MARLSLLDHAKRTDPDGKTAKIVEMLSQNNQILDDMNWMEGNLTTGHRTTVRTGYPTPTWRILNKGVAATKSDTAQIDEACGMLEDRSELDKDLAEMAPDLGAFRLSESMAHIDAMGQEMAQTLFYGNSSIDPEEFTGLSARFSDINAENGRNMVDAGGAGSDNTSIWLIVWGEQSISGIFPKGSKAGLVHEDLGVIDAFDSNNNRFRAYADRFQWKAGIALKDWRYVARLGSIDVSNLRDKSSAADLIDGMIQLTHRVENLVAGKACFYMNRTVIQRLDIQRRDDVMAGGGLTWDSVDGKLQYTFRGIPVRRCDAIVENETAI